MTPREEEARRLVATLKNLLRSKGLHYVDVANALGVSERSVQRWLNGEGLTLELLGQLCELIGISMAELFSLAESAMDERPRQLTQEQEAALVEVPLRAFLFSRLLQGWTVKELESACGLRDVEVLRHLLKFERLGLIELHPGNRVRLLTRPNIDWRKGGAMRAYFDHFAKRLVSAMDFGDPDAIWTSEAVYLSTASAASIEAKFRSLRLEIRHLAEVERDVPTEDKLWYSLLMMAYRHDLDQADDPLAASFTSPEGANSLPRFD